MTADPPGQVAAALAPLRPLAGEIVVAVDSRVDPDELGAYDGVVDRLLRFDFRPPVDRPRAWLAAQCGGDWLLSIDGDEVPSRALVDALPDLVAADDVVQYWLPRRWLYPDPATWLDESPWWPDFQVRLMRTGPTLVARSELHAGFLGVLPSRHVDAPIYHLDGVVGDASARVAKAAAYEAESPGRGAYGGGPLNEVMYHPERWATVPGRPVPGEDRSTIDAVLAARARAQADPPASAASGPTAPGPPVAVTAAGDIDAVASSPVLADGDYAVGLSLFDRAGGPGGPDGIDQPDVPLRLAPGEIRPLYVRVENRGGATWRWGLEQQPEIRMSYHWLSASGEMRVHDGVRTPLSCTIAPGAAAIVPVWVQVPDEPGEHRLDIDLVHEHVRWFESPLTLGVVVAERTRGAAC